MVLTPCPLAEGCSGCGSPSAHQWFGGKKASDKGRQWCKDADCYAQYEQWRKQNKRPRTASEDELHEPLSTAELELGDLNEIFQICGVRCAPDYCRFLC